MAFITSTSVSVQNGSKTVEVSGNVDLSSVDEGWAVQIGTNKLVEASSGTAPNSSGISTLTLYEPWQNGNVTAATMEIIPNSGYQIALAKRIKSIVDRTIGVMQLQHDYTSQLGQVTATDPETNEQHIYNTLRQNQSEIDALLESFGTAAGYDVTSSQTDVGNGNNGQPKLLKVGDGGVLKAINGATLNLDTVTTRGERTAYNFSGFTKGNWEQISVILNDAQFQGKDQIKQILHVIDGSGGMWERQSNDGGVTWHSEKEYIHTGNTGIKPSASGNTLIGTTTDNGIDKLQVSGTVSAGNIYSKARTSIASPVQNQWYDTVSLLDRDCKTVFFDSGKAGSHTSELIVVTYAFGSNSQINSTSKSLYGAGAFLEYQIAGNKLQVRTTIQGVEVINFRVNS